MASLPVSEALAPPLADNRRSTNDFETTLAGLRAAAEGTRLRILGVLRHGELTVSELCRVLGQTQPRVSRHLRLLCEADLLSRHTEGTNVFYALNSNTHSQSLVRSVLDLVHPADDTVHGDEARLDLIRAERATAADQYFERAAGHWDQVRSLHVAEDEVEAALLAAVAAHSPDGGTSRRLIDVGTGTGRILELLSDQIEFGLGVDLSVGMLNVARSNLVAGGHHHCKVRHSNLYALDVGRASFDLAVAHHVLHFLDDPAAAVAETAATLRPDGLLVVVDFAPHNLDYLRTKHRHKSLGFSNEEVAGWCRDAGLDDVSVTYLVPDPDPAQGELLTVALWTARQSTTTNRLLQRND